MEAMSPISKSLSDAGDMNEGKRNNSSTHYFTFFIFIWLIPSSVLALRRRALSSPYQWAVSMFALNLIYCGWSVFYLLLRKKLTDETSQVKLPRRHSWVKCTATPFCGWLNFSLDSHLSQEGMFSNLLLYLELGFILMRNASMLIQRLWDMWPRDFGEELLELPSVVLFGVTILLSRLFFLSMPLQIWTNFIGSLAPTLNVNL